MTAPNGPPPPPGFWTRLILGLLPAHVREEHQRELVEWLADERLPRDRWAGFTAWLGLLADLLRAAPRAHWDVLRQDLRHAGRSLRRAPGFAVVAIAMLAVGIGATATLFALVDGVLLRPLPYRHAERLVELVEHHPERDLRRFGISPANFTDMVRRSTWFDAAAAFQLRTATLRADDRAERQIIAGVTGGFFQVLTDPPILGRGLRPEDDVPEALAAVASHRYWTTALGGDPAAIGRTVVLDGRTVRLVGVMGPTFRFPEAGVALWIPLGLTTAEWERRGARYLTGVARLRVGVDIDQARGGVIGAAATLAERFPDTNRGWSASLLGQREAIGEAVADRLQLALVAAMLVLLIAVANVINLLLGRALTREREMAVRVALGARTSRVLRQLATEGLLLALAGAVLGLAITWISIRWLANVAGTTLPRVEELGLDIRVAGFVVVLAGVVSLVLTLVPGARASRIGPWQVLGSGRAGSSVGGARWQTGLVVTEVALAVVVLVSTGLVVRTMHRLLARPLGFEPGGALVFRVEPPWRFDPTGPLDSVRLQLARERGQTVARFDALFDAILAMPGVAAVGAINRLPLTGGWWMTSIDRAASPAATPDQRITAYIRPVTPGYLKAVGTAVLTGRAILETDRAGAEPVTVIDAALARVAFGTDEPVGQSLLLDSAPGQAAIRARVVGVVESVPMSGLATAIRPTLYVPLAQAVEGHAGNWGMDIVVRGAGVSRQSLVAAARSIFPEAPPFGLTDLATVPAASIAERRLQLWMLGVFAGVALLLTALGVAGLLYLVASQRRRDYAIRLALGAKPWTVFWDLEWWALRVAAVGAAIGLVAAILIGRGLQSLVYEVSVRDPLALASGPALGVVVALLAAGLPARRAATTDATRVLRQD